MFALISPNEVAIDYTQEVRGIRIADVAEQPFDVADPLYWIPCSVDVDRDHWYYKDGEILQLPPLPKMEDTLPLLVPDANSGPKVVA